MADPTANIDPDMRLRPGDRVQYTTAHQNKIREMHPSRVGIVECFYPNIREFDSPRADRNYLRVIPWFSTLVIDHTVIYAEFTYVALSVVGHSEWGYLYLPRSFVELGLVRVPPLFERAGSAADDHAGELWNEFNQCWTWGFTR